MKGVAYQQDYSGNGSTTSDQTYSDPLANADACKRDIPYLQELSTNTIRVYAINPDQNHDECMTMLSDAGIYVVADLSAPVDGSSINRDDPAWNDALYERYTSVVDAMANYTNVLGFFAGNEVSNAPNNTDASAFVKAAVRDTKAYIKSQGYRTIGVGYATNDDADIRVNMADFFNCGDPASAIDFWGYNIYSWCGDSSYTESGFDVRTKEFSTYSVPVFFAEYGCNAVSPRPFTEVGALFGSKMTPVWSGGIVYMYFQEANDYGLVSVDGNDVKTLEDFDNLKSEIAKVNPVGVNQADYTPSNTAAACPADGTDDWNAKSSPLPPSPNKQLCNCMYNSLSCVVTGSTNVDDYGDLFGTVCGYGDDICAGITANASTGDYGAYSMCNSTEQLAFALNQYYLSQNSAADACAFDGAAEVKSATTASGACETLMSEAGTAGTGLVTSSPTANSNDQAQQSGSGSGSHSSQGAGAPLGVPTAVSSLIPMAFIVTLGMISGAGMILL